MRELKLICWNLIAENSSRTPPGVRELKLVLTSSTLILVSRTPPGVRELKHPNARVIGIGYESHPSRGA